jgi:hypothetical protein
MMLMVEMKRMMKMRDYCVLLMPFFPNRLFVTAQKSIREERHQQNTVISHLHHPLHFNHEHHIPPLHLRSYLYYS